jgi:hypothetical protein
VAHRTLTSQKVNEAINEAKAFSLVLTATDSYHTIESAPHYPTMRGCYYNHPELPDPDYKALNMLLERFNPKTDEDKVLILAMLLTVVWGGVYGCSVGFDGQIVTVTSIVEPCVCLAVLPIAIAELRDKVGWVSSLCPRFAKIRTDGS